MNHLLQESHLSRHMGTFIYGLFSGKETSVPYLHYFIMFLNLKKIAETCNDLSTSS
jgi:hypothetical protein